MIASDLLPPPSKAGKLNTVSSEIKEGIRKLLNKPSFNLESIPVGVPNIRQMNRSNSRQLIGPTVSNKPLKNSIKKDQVDFSVPSEFGKLYQKHYVPKCRAFMNRFKGMSRSFEEVDTKKKIEVCASVEAKIDEHSDLVEKSKKMKRSISLRSFQGKIPTVKKTEKMFTENKIGCSKELVEKPNQDFSNAGTVKRKKKFRFFLPNSEKAKRISQKLEVKRDSIEDDIESSHIVAYEIDFECSDFQVSDWNENLIQRTQQLRTSKKRESILLETEKKVSI